MCWLEKYRSGAARTKISWRAPLWRFACRGVPWRVRQSSSPCTASRIGTIRDPRSCATNVPRIGKGGRTVASFRCVGMGCGTMARRGGCWIYARSTFLGSAWSVSGKWDGRCMLRCRWGRPTTDGILPRGMGLRDIFYTGNAGGMRRGRMRKKRLTTRTSTSPLNLRRNRRYSWSQACRCSWCPGLRARRGALRCATMRLESSTRLRCT